MTELDRFEVKASAFSVGVGLIFVSFVICYGAPESSFVTAIHEAGLGEWWGVIMFPVGVVLMYSSAKPYRELRHQSLCVAILMCYVTFGALSWYGGMTLSAMMIPWLGLMALTSLLVDICGNAKAKIRNAERSNVGAGHRATR